MRWIFILLLVGILFPASSLIAAQHSENYDSCVYCGMNLNTFSHSRMVVEYVDGGKVETCSLHCLALEFANAIDRTPQQILVGDYNTKNLIAAEQAVWVVGGDRPGVMTRNPKWAFSDRVSADEFVTHHGGQISSFKEAIEMAYVDMYEDTLRIRKMRKMKMMKEHKP